MNKKIKNSGRTFNNKGQITVFVIIGAILLFGAVIFFSINSSLQMDKPGLDIPDVSLEARPAHELVTTCLENVAEQALRIVGQQGGLMETPKVSYPPYRSEAIDFAPDIIPYWRFLDDCAESTSGCERVVVPPLCKPTNKICVDVSKGDNSIEEQVELYIEDNIGSCINEFKDIGQQYDISVDGKPDVEVFFMDGETDFKLSYPITITSLSTSNSEKVDDYLATFDLDFYNMYKLANEILLFERKTNFYETETMNLISMYSGINEPLPPLSEFTFFGQSGNIWIKQEVSDVLQYDLLPFMGLIRFMNTKNYFPIVDDYSVPDKYKQYGEGIYNRMSPQTSRTYYDLSVYHNYLYQPIFLEVNDGKQLIKPSDVVSEMGPFTKMMGLFMKDYRFKYYLSYPLVISIQDEDSFGGLGYTFQFATEVNIRNNIPGYFNFTTITTPVPFDANIDSFEQHLPQEITIVTNNRLTGEPLDDVVISYVCGKEYDLGMTSVDSSGVASLSTTLPYCEFGGAIRYQKTGFLGESISYNNLLNGTDETFNVELWPIKKREIIIKKRTEDDFNLIENSGENAYVAAQNIATDLSENQQVLFNLERVKETAYDTEVPLIGFLRYASAPETADPNVAYNELVQNIEYTFDQGIINESTRDELLEQAKNNDALPPIQNPDKYYVDLVPGTYSVEMTLLDKNGVHIPADTLDMAEDSSWSDKLVTDLFTDVDSTVIELPEQNFSTWALGGGTTEFELNAAKVYKDTPLIFYVLEMNRPESWDDMMNLKEIEEYQVGKEFYLNPKY